MLSSTSNKFYPQGATINNIEKYDDFKDALKIGELNKSKSGTKSNPFYSRSHTIFHIEFSYKKNSFNRASFESVSINIIDLVGVERMNKSRVIGSGLKEAGNINKSLLCLNNV